VKTLGFQQVARQYILTAADVSSAKSDSDVEVLHRPAIEINVEESLSTLHLSELGSPFSM
jgi:hypothetical protein